MVHALIFAGGTGKRMNSRAKPKQFLELHGKSVIIYTVEIFEKHPEVDDITIVCLEGWIGELEYQLKKNLIQKVKVIVPGGATGHESIALGLEAMKDIASDDDIVLIHDGVRPLITDKIISENIEAVKKYGSAITAAPAAETVVEACEAPDLRIASVTERGHTYTAKAPQSFLYGEILEAYRKSKEEGFLAIDSAHLLNHQGRDDLHIVPCSRHNLKITEPADYYIFRALYEAMENEQIGDI